MAKLRLRFLKTRESARLFLLKVRGIFKIRVRSFSKQAAEKVPRRIEFDMMTYGIVILVALTTILGLQGIFMLRSKFMERVPSEGGIYREGVIGSFENLNPLYSISNPVDQDAVTLIYSGLLKVDSGLNTVPDLAESVTAEDDGRVYRVMLKQGLKWHDGDALTAEDVLFTIETLKNPDAGSPLGRVWRGVRVEKISDYELKFSVPKIASFEKYLTQPILPSHKLSDIPAKNLAFYDEFNLHPVGSGPFAFNNLRVLSDGKELNLSVNANFYGAKPLLTGVTLRSYDSELDALNGLEKREVSAVAGLTGKYLERVTKIGYIDAVPLRIAEYTALFMNMKEPYLGDKRVRSAIAMAVNSDEIVANGDLERYPIYGPIMSGYLGYAASIRGPSYDPEGAVRQLEKAGFDLTGETAKNSKGEELSLRFVAPEGSSLDSVVERVARDLRAIKIKVNMERPSIVDYQASYVIPRNYSIILASENAGYDPDPYLYWHSTQAKDPGLNLSQLSSAKVDAALEAGRRASDPATRNTRYREFQRLIADEVPAVFLFGRYYYYLISDGVMGIVPTEFARIVEPKDRFSSVHEWHINTKWAWKKKDK